MDLNFSRCLVDTTVFSKDLIMLIASYMVTSMHENIANHKLVVRQAAHVTRFINKSAEDGQVYMYRLSSCGCWGPSMSPTDMKTTERKRHIRSFCGDRTTLYGRTDEKSFTPNEMVAECKLVLREFSRAFRNTAKHEAVYHIHKRLCASYDRLVLRSAAAMVEEAGTARSIELTTRTVDTFEALQHLDENIEALFNSGRLSILAVPTAVDMLLRERTKRQSSEDACILIHVAA